MSIHTPTKGATKGTVTFEIGPVDFNPHSHEGSDPIPAISAIQQRAFQSTLPRRERRVLSCNKRGYFLISIHTPTKGATFQKRTCIHDLIFQSTLPRRERLINMVNVVAKINFNPHSHEGSDLLYVVTSPSLTDFNPHSHEGSD